MRRNIFLSSIETLIQAYFRYLDLNIPSQPTNPKMSGEEFDYCEYVYNPLMRQYQAMLRLFQILSNSESQAECNDIECFEPNDPSSPYTILNSAGSGSTGSSLTSYLPLMFIWMLFAFALYALRPPSMRQKPAQTKTSHPGASDSAVRARPRFRDDDDDSFAS